MFGADIDLGRDVRLPTKVDLFFATSNLDLDSANNFPYRINVAGDHRRELTILSFTRADSFSPQDHL